MPQTLVKSLREEKRREENFSAQLFLCSCFYKNVSKICIFRNKKYRRKIMEVEKVDLQGVQPETKQTFQGKKSVQSDIHESNDEEKRNAAKLMKGAAVLAGIVAAGIIGHKLGKMFSKNVENALDEVSGIVTDAVRKAVKQSTEAVKSTNKAAEKVKPSVTETIEQTTVKPVQNNVEKAANKAEKTAEKAAETLNKSKSLDELAEEALKAGKKTFEKEKVPTFHGYKNLQTYDAKTRKLLEDKFIIVKDGKKGFTDKYDYDPKTGNLLKISSFDNENGQISWILDYDPKTGNIFKDTDFLGYEKLIRYYDPKTGKKLKQMSIRNDGSISSIGVYDAKTGHFIKSTQFYEDGKTVKMIEEYDPKTENIIPTHFDRDGNIIEKW